MTYKKISNISSESIIEYIERYKAITWVQILSRFDASKNTIRRRITTNQIVNSINNKRGYITLRSIIEKYMYENGIWKYRGIVFVDYFVFNK